MYSCVANMRACATTIRNLTTNQLTTRDLVNHSLIFQVIFVKKLDRIPRSIQGNHMKVKQKSADLHDKHVNILQYCTKRMALINKKNPVLNLNHAQFVTKGPSKNMQWHYGKLAHIISAFASSTQVCNLMLEG